MSDRPAYLTLRLTDPRMGHADRPRGGAEREVVLLVQQRFGLDASGLYDRPTAAAVQRWQWQQGAPVASGAIPAADLPILFGLRERPPEWIARAVERRVSGVWVTPPDPVDVTIPEPGAWSVRMIPRSAWTSRTPGPLSIVGHRRGRPIVGHWQGPGSGAIGLDACFAQLRGFWRYHVITLGWSDIGYHLAIPRGVGPGLVIECRDLAARGAHAGHNLANTYVGVLVMTGDEDDGPDVAQMATLAALRDALDHGRRTVHSEWSPTSCPGPVLTPWILANR